MDWVAFVCSMSAVRRVLVTLPIHSLLVTQGCECLKFTNGHKLLIFSQVFRDMMHSICGELIVLYMKKANIGEYLCLLKESFYEPHEHRTVMTY